MAVDGTKPGWMLALHNSMHPPWDTIGEKERATYSKEMVEALYAESLLEMATEWHRRFCKADVDAAVNALVLATLSGALSDKDASALYAATYMLETHREEERAELSEWVKHTMAEGRADES